MSGVESGVEEPADPRFGRHAAAISCTSLTHSLACVAVVASVAVRMRMCVVRRYYNISEAQVDLLLNWGTIAYVASAPFVVRWGRTPEGLRRMMWLALACEVFAVAARLIPQVPAWHDPLKPYAIYFLHFAHISNAVACPPITVTITKLSCVWFSTHERPATTALMVVSNNLGTAVGMVLGPAVVTDPDRIPTLLYIHGGFGVFAAICMALHLPSMPPSHPSPAAAQMFAAPDEAFLPALVKALRNSHFMVLGMCAGLVTGQFTAWSGILATILPADQYPESTVGWFSAGATLASIAGGIFHAVLVSRYPRLRMKLKALITALVWGALVSGTFFTLSLQSVVSPAQPLFQFSHNLPALGGALVVFGWFIGTTSHPLQPHSQIRTATMLAPRMHRSACVKGAESKSENKSHRIESSGSSSHFCSSPPCVCVLCCVLFVC